MDTISYENPSKSEVIGSCGGDEKNEWPRRTDKSRTLKITIKKIDNKNLLLYSTALRTGSCSSLDVLNQTWCLRYLCEYCRKTFIQDIEAEFMSDRWMVYLSQQFVALSACITSITCWGRKTSAYCKTGTG